MNLHLFVGLLPTLPAGGATAVLLSLLPFLLPGITLALAADPADPGARVPAISYRSAFDGYERWRDSPKAPWRESNELVGRMGGHPGHVEDAPAGGQPPAASAPAAPDQRPAGGQHQHHKP